MLRIRDKKTRRNVPGQTRNQGKVSKRSGRVGQTQRRTFARAPTVTKSVFLLLRTNDADFSQPRMSSQFPKEATGEM